MFNNTLLMALRAIRRNAMRSFLTILGIVIGVASVVALVTIGEGSSKQVAAEIGALGENLLTVRPGAHFRPGGARQAAKAFEMSDVGAIERDIGGIDHVAPTASSRQVAVFGNTNWSTSVTGTTNTYLDCRGYKIEGGRAFSAAEEDGGRPVCVLGTTVVRELFQDSEPIGQRIRVGKVSCSVIGTLASKGQAAMGMDQDDLVLMPIKAFQRRVAGNNDVSSIEISVNKQRATSVVKTQIESLMRERRGVKPGADDDFHVRDMQEIVAAIQQTSSVLTTLLSAIAAVSLLVGGIGIMNIMLVSVTERTREIGIRLAIGATGAEVMQQFLVEAAVLSGFGGLFGLLLGNGSALIATSALGLPYLPSPFIALIAFTFSVLVGIAFGFLPARKAARLNPMEALRYE